MFNIRAINMTCSLGGDIRMVAGRVLPGLCPSGGYDEYTGEPDDGVWLYDGGNSQQLLTARSDLVFGPTCLNGTTLE